MSFVWYFSIFWNWSECQCVKSIRQGVQWEEEPNTMLSISFQRVVDLVKWLWMPPAFLSPRFQCTCIAVSRRWLALGSSGGGVNLIQKEGWKHRLFLSHRVRSRGALSCAVQSLLCKYEYVQCSESFIINTECKTWGFKSIFPFVPRKVQFLRLPVVHMMMSTLL